MRTVWPASTSSSTPTGSIATRYSWDLVSLGIPMITATSRGWGRGCRLSRGTRLVSLRDPLTDGYAFGGPVGADALFQKHLEQAVHVHHQFTDRQQPALDDIAR